MILFFFALGGILHAQSIEGVWVTVDDKTNEPKSHVKIYKEGEKYFGKIIKLLPAAATKICSECDGDLKDAPLEGLVIINDLESYKEDYYSYGTIMDPKNGKSYKLSVWQEEEKLKVRGYIGIEALGRTQIWSKLE